MESYVASSTAVFSEIAGGLWTGFLGIVPELLYIAGGILLAFWGWGKIKRHGFKGSKS